MEERLLLDAIARKKEEVVELERRRRSTEDELRRLETELERLDAPGRNPLPQSRNSTIAVPASGTEKVALFRSLFRGRDDVFPLLWTNRRTGRTGYAPACGNEWVPSVCEKPRVRCGECPNQAFLPVRDQVLLDHLQGRHVAGVYPLLRDETCRFLAADFDGADWMKDVAAFRETCRSAGLPVAVERSRSGNGGHAWLFFDAPVSAAAARQMGCYLITRAMSSRHTLGMSSYDRLFPNQDTLPRGGFGNLIALPLQRSARAQGNSVFVDDAFRPFTDQWTFLAAVRRIPASTVERIAAEAQREQQILGVRAVAIDEDDANAPWLLKPSHRWKPRLPVIDKPLPPRAKATLAQHLFVAKGSLPSPVLDALKRVAAFSNPEFYQRQSMRLSTALTPRVIACAEDLPRHVALPRGCVDGAAALLRRFACTLEVNDRREAGRTIKHGFRGTPTDLQKNAVRALLGHEIGVLVAPPGVGKTVAGIQLIAERGRNTLVLVHRRPLLDQWIAQLQMFLNVESGSIGRIGGGKRHVTGLIEVAMIQSLVKKEKVADLVAEYGHVMVDECHHVPAVSFERVLAEVRARYVTGLTATPRRRDGLHPIVEMQLGPARYVVNPKAASTSRPLVRRLIVRETSFELGADPAPPIQRLYRSLAHDKPRNALILDDVIGSIEAGRSPIVLTERRDHLDLLADQLRGFVKHLIVLKGGVTARKQQQLLAALGAVPGGEERLVLATGRYVGEGFDDARLDTLFLTMPISWRGTVVQYTGRLHRAHPGKDGVRIYDYVDRRVPVLARMYERRLAGYRSIGYELAEEVVP